MNLIATAIKFKKQIAQMEILSTSTIMTKIIMFIITALSIFTPIVPLMVTCGFLIFIDFGTGLWKSLKKGQSFTSSKMANTISKLVLYQVAIISAYMLQLYIMPMVPVVKIISGFLAMTEFKSLIENIGEITKIDIWTNIKQFLIKKSDNNPDGKIK